MPKKQQRERDSQLARSRRAVADDKADAAKWLRDNEKKVTPPIKRDRVQVEGYGLVDRLVQLWEGAEEEPTVYDERQRFVPMQGRDHEIDVQSASMAARVNHVLSFLSESQEELLRAYYIEGLSLPECARGEESYQAVQQRLQWARRAFLKAWRDHAADEIELREEDF